MKVKDLIRNLKDLNQEENIGFLIESPEGGFHRLDTYQFARHMEGTLVSAEFKEGIFLRIGPLTEDNKLSYFTPPR
jgi:hypothetical protein